MSDDINSILGITNDLKKEDNSIQSNHFSNPKLISKIVSVIAVVSIIFLPVVGCESKNINGIDIVTSEQMSPAIKLFLIFAVVCGIIIFFLKEYLHLAVTAIIGIVTLLISYLIAKDKLGLLELKIGGFLSILSYSVIAVIGFVKSSEKKNIEMVTTVEKQTSHKKSEPSNDIFTQIEKLNELQQKGILTEEEFSKKKTELLSKL